jgi:hypothetical protein
MKDFLKSLFDRPTVLVLVSGIVFLLIGAAGTLAWKGTGIVVADPVWRIVIGVIGALLTGLGVMLIVRDTLYPRPGRPLKTKYDVFLASPMAALDKKPLFDKQRAEVTRIKDALRKYAGVTSIYDSGEGLKFGKWEPKDFAADIDLEALRTSRYFILVYPEKIVSSVLFEAGAAIGMGKPGIYIVTDSEKGLPYLMQQMNNLPRRYPQVRIWECEDIDRIVARIELSGKQIFTEDKPATPEAPAAA